MDTTASSGHWSIDAGPSRGQRLSDFLLHPAQRPAYPTALLPAYVHPADFAFVRYVDQADGTHKEWTHNHTTAPQRMRTRTRSPIPASAPQRLRRHVAARHLRWPVRAAGTVWGPHACALLGYLVLCPRRQVFSVWADGDRTANVGTTFCPFGP